MAMCDGFDEDDLVELEVGILTNPVSVEGGQVRALVGDAARLELGDTTKVSRLIVDVHLVVLRLRPTRRIRMQ